MKFNTEDNGFVKAKTLGNRVMMVIEARDGVIPRYDLQAVDGAIYRNIGEYELSQASEAEVAAALKAAA